MVFFFQLQPKGRKVQSNVKLKLTTVLRQGGKNRTFFSLSFCLDTKERKNQVSIEDVRLKFFIDRYTKRVISKAYQTTSAFRYRLRLKIFFTLSLPIETKKKRTWR